MLKQLPARSTRAVLLDEAERLFAEKGVQGTSIRQLSKAAGVNVAAVNYYFGSKNGLVKAVLERRLRPINEARSQRLKALLAKQKEGSPLPIREVVRAFVEPAFEQLAKDDQARHFLTFLGRAMADLDPLVWKFFAEEMKETALLFWKALKAALPHLSEEKLYWRFQFLLGAMVRLLAWRKNYEFLPPIFEARPLSMIDKLEEFILFVTAGLEAEDAL